MNDQFHIGDDDNRKNYQKISCTLIVVIIYKDDKNYV